MTAQAERASDFRDALVRDGFDPFTATLLDGRARNVSIDERGGRRTATVRMSMDAYNELGASMALGSMRILNVLATVNDTVEIELMLPEKYNSTSKPCRCGHPVAEHTRELEFLLTYARCAAAKMDGERCRCRIPEVDFLAQWTAPPEERSPLAPVRGSFVPAPVRRSRLRDSVTGIQLEPDERVVRSRRWDGKGMVMVPSDFMEVSPVPLPTDPDAGGVLVPVEAFEKVRDGFAKMGAAIADSLGSALGPQSRTPQRPVAPRIEKRVSPPVVLPKPGRRRLRFDD